jgi:hypothetical protein
MAGGFEYENPTRRYKWFRPRQAARGYLLDTSGISHPTGGLYNNSTGAHVLIVRELISTALPSVTGNVGWAYVQGMPGTVGGTVTPLIPMQGALPGQLWSADLAFYYTPDFLPPAVAGSGNFSYWGHEFPLAVLPPGWSIALAGALASGDVVLSVMWEAIYPEELDYLY